MGEGFSAADARWELRSPHGRRPRLILQREAHVGAMKRWLVRLRRFWRWWGKPAYLSMKARIIVFLIAAYFAFGLFHEIVWLRRFPPDPHPSVELHYIWAPPQST